MRTLGNILWFIFCGLWLGLSWFLVGLIWCITIIGLPVGRQCFKFARLSFMPFHKNIIYSGGVVSVLLNIFWLIFGGFVLAIENAVFGCLLCVTIIGIPFGMQCFKLAKLALMPFGADVADIL